MRVLKGRLSKGPNWRQEVALPFQIRWRTQSLLAKTALKKQTRILWFSDAYGLKHTAESSLSLTKCSTLKTELRWNSWRRYLRQTNWKTSGLHCNWGMSNFNVDREVGQVEMKCNVGLGHIARRTQYRDEFQNRQSVRISFQERHTLHPLLLFKH